MPHAGYNTSFEKAVDAVKNLEAPGRAARGRGADFSGDGFDLEYFGKPCRVSIPEFEFSPTHLSLGEKILILHYLTSDGSVENNPPPATFEGLRGGMFYFETFRKRGPERVLNDFREDPALLSRIAGLQGWTQGEAGDVSIVIPVLPLIDLTVVYYAADEEFPAEVKFLFRKDITSLLPLEDIAALGGFAATRLVIEKSSV